MLFKRDTLVNYPPADRQDVQLHRNPINLNEISNPLTWNWYLLGVFQSKCKAESTPVRYHLRSRRNTASTTRKAKSAWSKVAIIYVNSQGWHPYTYRLAHAGWSPLSVFHKETTVSGESLTNATEWRVFRPTPKHITFAFSPSEYRIKRRVREQSRTVEKRIKKNEPAICKFRLYATPLITGVTLSNDMSYTPNK